MTTEDYRSIICFLPGMFFLITEDVYVFSDTAMAILHCYITEFNNNILWENFANRPIHATLKTSTYGILSKVYQDFNFVKEN